MQVDAMLGVDGSHDALAQAPAQQLPPSGHDHGHDQSTRQRPRRDAEHLVTHQCRICERTYERADRLSRHMRTHENARRYLCQRCQKRFNRADLLTRHMTTHCRNGAEAVASRKEIHRTDRAGQACVACVAAKARCENQKPCRRCQTKVIICEVASQTLLHGARRQVSDIRASENVSSADSSPSSLNQNITALQQQEQQYLADGAALITDQQLSTLVQDHHSIAGCNETTEGQVVHLAPTSSEPLLAQLEGYDMNSTPLDSDQLALDNIMREMLFMPIAFDFNNQNFDMNFHDIALEDETMANFSVPYVDGNNAAAVDSGGQTPRPARDVRASYAAFTRSPWLYTPTALDGVLKDGENLQLDERSVTSALTPSSSGPMPNVPSCGLPVIKWPMRDKMHHLLSTMTKYSSRIPDFPSIEIINHLVEAYFVRQTYQVDNWIHVPSMSLPDLLPELGLAVIIAGSTIISVPAVWKMGLVLQDVIRVKLGELWDRENSATRQLQPLQAWMLSLDVGMWSGFQRHMELSESFGQTLITMMRRGGMFGAIADTEALVPHESDTGQVLDAKWKKWTQRESFKRLSIHLFLHDTQASIALQKYPLLSITEITISLPESRMLFLAGSAMEWKSCYIQAKPPGRPSLQLVDVMHDIGVLDDQCSGTDVKLCYTAGVHGFWCQVWSFRESWKFHLSRETKDSVHRLWLTTQQRELHQQIENFEHDLLLRNPQSELLIMLELMLMILHISPDELQRFAGKYGEEAASLALASLERWRDTENARRAVCHAGQVYRWAAMMPPTGLRYFYAVAVYFASLTLWTYGHLSSSTNTRNEVEKQDRPSSIEEDSNEYIIINSKEIAGVRSFISGRQIIPVLTPVIFKPDYRGNGMLNDTLVQLDNPHAVLQIGRQLYRSNFPIEGESLPPLVENLGNLMRDLDGLSENRFSRSVSQVD